MSYRYLFNLFAILTIPTISFFWLSLKTLQTPENQTTPSISGENHYCGSDYFHTHFLNKKNKKQLNSLEILYQNHLNANQNKSVTPPNYILPVVVHIIHNGGSENIPDSQVENAILHLNEAYENIGYYNPNIGVDTKIQFCLAKQDPSGNPSTGINRVQSPLTEMTMETQDLDVKDLSRWDPLRYINIWIVGKILSQSVGTGVAGYAYFPTSHGGDEDGIMNEAQYFGSTNPNSGVHIHEMGHYLGLYHTFQGSCTNNDCMADGDRVCDTPPDQSTAQVACNDTANTCMTDINSGFATDQNDMFWNYMDYGNLNCYSAFTQGQADRMAFFIDNVRSSLLNSQGCDDPCPTLVTIDFSASETQVLINSTVNFTNNSMNGNTWEWSVNGDPPFSTNFNADFNFSQTGIFWVFLTANPGDPLCERTDSLKIKVALCGQNAHVSNTLGNNTSGCGDLNNMCETIQYALDNIVCDADTIFIHSGTYSLAAGISDLVPIAKMPEGLSITLFGVWDDAPVILDGGNTRRAVQYNYLGNSCIDSNPNDGIAESVALNFNNLNFENCLRDAFNCNNTTLTYGGAIQIYNDLESQMNVQFYNCQFFNNYANDLSGPNNNGRAASGGAIYFNGRASTNAPPSTESSIQIDSCLFVGNGCNQFPNGGHGGAVCVLFSQSATISNSFFCNNFVYSENADDGDLMFTRNIGGAVAFYDNTNLVMPHLYQVEDSYFVGNSALTGDGATFPSSSGAGGIYLVYGTGPSNFTPNILSIFGSHFYDNINEDGPFHYGNSTGTLQVSTTITGDEFNIDLGNDTTLCNDGILVLGDTLPFATYLWNTGDTTAIIEVMNVGIYSVTVVIGECSAVGNIEILPCEECGNGIDDDSDGLVDCDDPDLQNTCCCLPQPILDLGPDLNNCEETVQVLNAGSSFETYIWQDGLTQTQEFTAFQSGTYWVTVLDSCDNMQSDTIVISTDSAMEINLGSDSLICEGQSVTFSLNGFTTYEWQPTATLDCTDCSTVIATPSVSELYIVNATDENGCSRSDSMLILVIPENGNLIDSMTICQGDTIDVFGEMVFESGNFIDTVSNFGCEYYHLINVEIADSVLTMQTVFLCENDSILLYGNFENEAGFYQQIYTGENGCDSTDVTELVLLETFNVTDSVMICEMDTVILHGNLETQVGIYEALFIAENGCDSIHRFVLEVVDVINTSENPTICPEDSILIFGNFETGAGNYSQVGIAAGGCDSIHTITLDVLNSLLIDFQTSPTCPNESTGTVFAQVSGGLPPYQYFWETSGQGTETLTDLATGDYGLTVIDDFGCEIKGNFTVNSASTVDIEIETTDETCFGANDGILVISPIANLTYSLNGLPFTPQATYDNLQSGSYILSYLDDNNCENEVLFDINAAVEIFIDLPEDTFICLGDSLQLNTQTNVFNAPIFEWTPPLGLSCVDCPRPFARPFATTTYTAVVTNEDACTASDEIRVIVQPKREIFLPNVFSPNNDGINDYFYPQAGAGIAQILEFKVFDRWGELVFENNAFQPNNFVAGWDGTFRGKIMDSGIFVWYVKAAFLDNEVEVLKGDVLLLR
jgi:gliding motility-associated-like protein